MRIKILLADDHPLICEGIKQICLSDKCFNKVKSVKNGEELVSSYSKIVPDLIIVDISMPVLDGVAAFKEIKKMNDNVKCLFYSFCGCKQEIYRLYELGAKGYICKSRTPREVLKAIRTVVSGDLYFDKSFSRKDFSEFQSSLTKERFLNKKRRLSKREADIIIQVADGLSNNQISQKLEISVKTVEVHRRNIRKKFGLKGSSELMKYAIETVNQFANRN